MALVCDIKSESAEEKLSTKQEELDLEDGEIEDDEDDPTPIPDPVEPSLPPPPDIIKLDIEPPPFIEKLPKPPQDREEPKREKNRDRASRSERRKHEEKGKRHMTEAEKSILHLRKREEAQRKKWEKMNRTREILDPLAIPPFTDDDFAKNIEKTLATILNKKEKEAAAAASSSDDRDKDKSDRERDEDKRGRKRRKNEKERKNKQRRFDSPKSDIEEPEMVEFRGPPEHHFDDLSTSMISEDSFDSGDSSDRNRVDERMKRREKKIMRRNRDRGYKDKQNKRDGKKNDNNQALMKDSQGVCVFYLQGKCLKADCPYSHETAPPMKLELCKFYLMSCCAKGEKCSYMHSDFPCKFYHTGLTCNAGDDCKFAHGKPLSDSLKQILFKHIETAPREILGGFPRVTREEALNLIEMAQSKLQEKFDTEEGNKDESKGGIPSLFDLNVAVPPELLHGFDGKAIEKIIRHRTSRWQQDSAGPGPHEDPFPIKPFNYPTDQDMRINSNGDIDMRTLPPPPLANMSPQLLPNNDVQRAYDANKDVDIRMMQDVDIRQIPAVFNPLINADENVQIDEQTEEKEDTPPSLPKNLPKTQRDLFLRIQAHQKDVVKEDKKEEVPFDSSNINWYSDDDDDDENRLTIKDENEDVKEKDEPTDEAEAELMSPPRIKPLEAVEKIDLSKIDISAEVTKLLTTMSQGRQYQEKSSNVSTMASCSSPTSSGSGLSDPRMQRQDPRIDKEGHRADPRLNPAPKQRSRQSSSDSQSRPEKISIYEQGSLEKSEDTDIDLRGMRSDVDLRNLQLPFKGMQNYTPASEIDASLNSHDPIPWKLNLVEVPRPDYTGLKLSISDAEKTGDPRLRKIFRLSTEERDTPLSPKASPKSNTATRVDPRLKKMEESKSSDQMSFNQQVSALQSSAFYQSLTSNQKLLLNQELSILKNDSGNSHDPVLNSILSNLNIIPNSANMPSNSGAALSILASISKLNPMMNQGPTNNMPPHMMNQMAASQPGLLGAAPGIPNLTPDFPINFDPRNGGLLGNAPNAMAFGGGFPPQENNFNFNEDFYPTEGNDGNGGDGGGFQGGRDGGFQGGRDGGGFQGGGGRGGNFQGRDNFHGRDNHRGFNRDRRRGRNFNHRNHSGNRNFRRNNRTNRNHSPP